MNRRICKSFKKSKNGFCINYIGCKREIKTCSTECILEGYKENKCKDDVCKL